MIFSHLFVCGLNGCDRYANIRWGGTRKLRPSTAFQKKKNNRSSTTIFQETQVCVNNWYLESQDIKKQPLPSFKKNVYIYIIFENKNKILHGIVVVIINKVVVNLYRLKY